MFKVESETTMTHGLTEGQFVAFLQLAKVPFERAGYYSIHQTVEERQKSNSYQVIMAGNPERLIPILQYHFSLPHYQIFQQPPGYGTSSIEFVLRTEVEERIIEVLRKNV